MDNKEVKVHESGTTYYEIVLNSTETEQEPLVLRLFEDMSNKRLDFETRQEYLIRRQYMNEYDKKRKKGFIAWPTGKYGTLTKEKAMQVMECWNKVMTVKCEGGCMSKPYSDFNKITDLRGKKVFKSSYFEDNRKTINKKNKLK